MRQSEYTERFQTNINWKLLFPDMSAGGLPMINPVATSTTSANAFIQ
jgi:hypothetical protein